MLGKNRRGQARPVSGAWCQQDPSAVHCQGCPNTDKRPLSSSSIASPSKSHCQGREGSTGEALRQNEAVAISCSENERDNHRLPSCRCSRKRENTPRSLASCHQSSGDPAARALAEASSVRGKRLVFNESVTRNAYPRTMKLAEKSISKPPPFGPGRQRPPAKEHYLRSTRWSMPKYHLQECRIINYVYKSPRCLTLRHSIRKTTVRLFGPHTFSRNYAKRV